MRKSYKDRDHSHAKSARANRTATARFRSKVGGMIQRQGWNGKERQRPDEGAVAALAKGVH